MEISFGEKGTKGEFTLQEGDWVQFNVATDRRDQLQHATNIELLDESFLVSGETREQGVVAAVEENYGFVNCKQKDSRIYFRLSELLDSSETLVPQDEIEFTVTKDISSNNRLQATRIRKLPSGTVKGIQGCTYKNHTSDTLTGLDNKESGDFNATSICQKISKCSVDGNCAGLGSDYELFCNGEADAEDNDAFCEDDDKKQTRYFVRDLENQIESYSRDISSPASVKSRVDSPITDIKIAGRNSLNGFKCSHRGFVAAMKDGFGFIETEDHEREIFFHFSGYNGNINGLEIGQEVEYVLSCKGSKLSAENVHKLPSGSIPGEDVMPEVLNGIVVRPVRCFNPEQEEYCGLIKVTGDETMESDQNYPFGITSLAEKHELLQKGDVVQFQIGIVKGKGQQRAVNIKAIRTSFQATVDTIKGNFGFLSHEVEEGKKLFFHMSEVKGGINLQSGDKVEFVILHHQRTGKYSACRVVKIGDCQPAQRPERLISRLRSVSLSGNSPRVVVVRQPRGPDGTNGFKVPRQVVTDLPFLGEINIQMNADADAASSVDIANESQNLCCV